MGDVYIDPSKLRSLPRSIVPDVVRHIPPPPKLPALPWLFVCLVLMAMPFGFSLSMLFKHGKGTCDRNVVLYLQLQVTSSIAYIVVAVAYWKRINWVGDLKDALAEIPELWQYVASTMIWWFEFGASLFGCICAAQASACSSGLRYASETLAGYMLGCGCWLNFAFFIGVPCFLHIYSGQPGSDLVPPGATLMQVPDSLPKPPPKRKVSPPKRECPRCRASDEIPLALKLCPVSSSFNKIMQLSKPVRLF